MPGKLQKEIAKTGPFAALEEEASLNILRTADRLAGCFEHILKPKGLTPTQYNVLRILRGVSPQGIACQEIARRMITRDADLTRLLDRMESRKLVSRQRQTNDRRVVHISIAQTGLNLLAELDAAVVEMNKMLLGHMSPEKLHNLIDLLELAREHAEDDQPPLT
jgi:DNA-binding MarR family transcriptional regulator